MHHTLRRALRRPALIATALAGALLLGACSGSTDDDTTTSSSGGFEPVSIEHALGTAEIAEQPERVVTLGMGSAETVIALGTVPVGIEEYPWGSDDTGYLPWIHEALTERGEELPPQITGGTELDVESIAALEPDVILAPWSGITKDQYDLLTNIAPTVAYPELPWTITWQQQIETIGTALGKHDEALGLIADIDRTFAESVAAHPEYAGVTFSYIYNTGPGTLGVFLADEQRVAMVRGLGLTVDPVVYTLEETEGTDSSVIGLENAHLLADSDLVFTFYSDPENRRQIEEQPVYQQIPAVERGSLVAPEEQPFVTGSSIINPLTVPWALERYVPLIDAAIANLDR
ncbi:MAG: iron-siderophore ABC transporter substrate-binding protein [Rhodococcus sp.]|uniref:iron-siderophore ABC transporter substrate-binding protein n=1 Tax=Rhodococcus sp. TaxID=1831 RepID=UPI0016AD0DB8|nr:iron-siderophore ABC transporter substrate-binding protein [Rhodococcus sp. (in: high G+C Gram-positive bacteria)]NLV78664.1 iron-siderophore ABC transporter substrate-binding protein [Rhodococcus sp. (in: high G+C Gram-positive bacteria)]